LPFARVSLKTLIPKPYDFVPISVGDHVRKKRLELELQQKEAAQQLGVNPWTVLNWEKGHTQPPVSAMPAIFQFLGYDPYPEPKTLPGRLLAKRREMGWSIKQAAHHVNVDPGTWKRWERGGTISYRPYRLRVASLLGLSADALEREMAMQWGQLHTGGH
jgi:DNA-binding XRE family transcriptional regulator